MYWEFPPEESKTGFRTNQARIVYVPSDIADIVREQMRNCSNGDHVFRNSHGNPWKRGSLSTAFGNLKKRLAKHGVVLDAVDTLYSCRHTFARRQLASGTSLEILAGLMGNTPQVCYTCYAKWSTKHQQPMWDAIDT
jgi:integrase